MYAAGLVSEVTLEKICLTVHLSILHLCANKSNSYRIQEKL